MIRITIMPLGMNFPPKCDVKFILFLNRNRTLSSVQKSSGCIKLKTSFSLSCWQRRIFDVIVNDSLFKVVPRFYSPTKYLRKKVAKRVFVVSSSLSFENAYNCVSPAIIEALVCVALALSVAVAVTVT